MPKPCDCVGKCVPAALTAATYFVVLVGMCLAAASWQSKNGLLLTLPPSHLQLLPAMAQAVLFDGRNALACCQLAV